MNKSILDYSKMSLKKLEIEYAKEYGYLIRMYQSCMYDNNDIKRQISLVKLIQSIIDVHYKIIKFSKGEL